MNGPVALTYRVIFADTDAGGIVYHARYFEMAERSRMEAARSIGLEIASLFHDQSLGLIVRTARLSFHSPAIFDDLLVLHEIIIELTRSRSVWLTRIRRGAKQICSVETELVCYDRDARAPIFFPDDVHCALTKLMRNNPINNSIRSRATLLRAGASVGTSS